MKAKKNRDSDPIILFDGVCNLCNASINFVINRDKNRRFRFASLQSETGKKLLSSHGLPAGSLYSLVLIENGRAFERSSAALRICRSLKFPWPVMYLFMIVPPFIRNTIYNLIADNRYRWFGREESCRVPEPGLRERFLDQES